MNRVCNFLKQANQYFSDEKVHADNRDHVFSASLTGVTTLAVGLLSIFGRGKLGFQGALPVATLGYAANIGTRVTAKKLSGCKGETAQHIANPLSRGVVFGALFASVVGALKGKTGCLTLASVATIAFAQAAEPKHAQSLFNKFIKSLVPIIIV